MYYNHLPWETENNNREQIEGIHIVRSLYYIFTRDGFGLYTIHVPLMHYIHHWIIQLLRNVMCVPRVKIEFFFSFAASEGRYYVF